MSLSGHVWNALAYLRTQSEVNRALAVLTVLGMAIWVFDTVRDGRRGRFAAAFALPCGAGLLLLTCYWGEMAHPYYALVFAATAAMGMVGIATLPGRLIRGRSTAYAGAAISTVMCLLLLPLSAHFAKARPLRGVVREEMPQVRFAQTIREQENATLLDLCSLDQGFYLASGILPNCRYFADNNLDTAEKREAIASYLENAVCDYVVTVWKNPGERYEPVMQASGVFDLNDKRDYTLWRRKQSTDSAKGE